MGKSKTHEEFIEEMKEKNNNITILGIYQTSKTPILCHCNICNHDWVSEPRRLSSGQGCPYCAGNKKKTHKEFIEEMYSKNPHIKILSHYVSNSSKVSVKCIICGHEWNTKPNTLLTGHGCPKCAKKSIVVNARKSHDKFIDDLKHINPNINVLEVYVNSYTKILCKCKKCGHEWRVKPNNLLNSQGCPCCNATSLKTTEKFKLEMLDRHPEIEVVGEYINNKTKIECKCKLCNKTFFNSPTKMLSSSKKGCQECAILYGQLSRRKSKEQFVKELSDINSSVLALTPYISIKEKITCKCKKCGEVWDTTPDYLLRGFGCKKCNISIGENLIYDWLSKHNIDFDIHRTFDGLRGVNNGLLNYDFYISSWNMLIEFQGIQHYQPVEYFGGKESFLTQQEHDKRKRDYAKQNGIILLEIRFDQKNEISDILSNVMEVQHERMVS